MDSIIQSDIFFFISSISFVIFTIFFIIIGFYLVKAMKNFYHVSQTLRDAVDDTDKELREMIDHVKESSIFHFLFGKKKSKKKSVK